jgi:putative ABC transport system substrate-binding protein
MKNRSLKILISCGVVFFNMILSCGADTLSSGQSNGVAAASQVVAITQIAPHPSLDLIRKGIEDELAEQKIVCDIHFENAQGNMATATQIAQKFVSQKPAVIVPITTPSTQTVYAVARLQNIPIVFAAVNDPVSIKLVPNMSQAGKGITGISDMPPITEQVALIREIFPNIKKIGVVYNPGESNSVALLAIFEAALAQNGIALFRATAANMVDVAVAANSLVGKVEAIYIPNDNTVVSALDALLKVTQANGIPVFSADPESVKQGCLGAVAHSQYGLGRQAGKMVVKVLKGTDIQMLPVERPTEIELSLNQDTAGALGITLPEQVMKRAKYVIKK